MKLLLYCAKAKPMLRVAKEDLFKHQDRARCYKQWEIKYFTKYVSEEMYEANGKIVAECDFEIEKIEYKHIKERDKFGILHNEAWFEYRGVNIGNEDCDLPNKSCLTVEEIFDYLINKNGYAIHIKNLHIFDKPKELSDFNRIIETTYGEEPDATITKAPQNMMRCCYENKPKEWKLGVLISIQSEWLCKILNGEKTIEVRKKVLKEMLIND